MNVQYAIQNGMVYVLEVNPRASRTVPYVSKATGVPLPKIAVGLDVGAQTEEITATSPAASSAVPQYFVKSPGLPIQQIPRRGSGARPGDAFHRRSDGRRR